MTPDLSAFVTEVSMSKNKVTDEAVEEARKVLAKRRWIVPKSDETGMRHLREALQAAFDVMPTKERRVLDSPAQAYDRAIRAYGTPPEGEGTHPLQRHRDSMG